MSKNNMRRNLVPRDCDNPFVQVGSEVVRNSSVSLAAKGLWTVMLDLKPDWELTVRGLAKITGSCHKTIQKLFDELKDAGYLREYGFTQRTREYILDEKRLVSVPVGPARDSVQQGVSGANNAVSVPVGPAECSDSPHNSITILSIKRDAATQSAPDVAAIAAPVAPASPETRSVPAAEAAVTPVSVFKAKVLSPVDQLKQLYPELHFYVDSRGTILDELYNTYDSVTLSVTGNALRRTA
jgi:hypothetical protein